MSTPILDQVLSCPDLPTLPGVAVELLEMTCDPDVEVGDIADLVQNDQALTGRILRTVNSSYYSLSQPCSTIRRALAYLGLSTVKSLVLGFSLVQMTRSCDEAFDLPDYWRRCLASAAAARRIAMTTGACDPEEAFVAALMQDIGMLAMHAALKGDYDAVLSETAGNHYLLPRCESVKLGFTHAEAGARLGRRWHLPDQIIEPILYHHRSGVLGYVGSPMVHTVILAYRVSHLMTTTDRKPALAMVDAMSQALLHMSVEDERVTLECISADIKELASLLEVEVGVFPDVRSILNEADGQVPADQVEPGREAGQAPPTVEDHASMTDELTGLDNRRSLDQQLGKAFKQAIDEKGSLALVLVDVDRFKALNDGAGHQAGDQALQQLAQRLQLGMGKAGIACRCEGGTFAILIAGTGRVEAARVAERLRRQIERSLFSLHARNGEIGYAQVTASFGVAALEPDVADQLNRPGLLMQLADNALSAAKRAGRNRVRVFNPAPDSKAA